MLQMLKQARATYFRPDPIVVETITDRRGKTRDILYYPVPIPSRPPTNGFYEVARRLRQLAALQLQVSA